MSNRRLLVLPFLVALMLGLAAGVAMAAGEAQTHLKKALSALDRGDKDGAEKSVQLAIGSAQQSGDDVVLGKGQTALDALRKGDTAGAKSSVRSALGLSVAATDPDEPKTSAAKDPGKKSTAVGAAATDGSTIPQTDGGTLLLPGAGVLLLAVGLWLLRPWRFVRGDRAGNTS